MIKKSVDFFHTRGGGGSIPNSHFLKSVDFQGGGGWSRVQFQHFLKYVPMNFVLFHPELYKIIFYGRVEECVEKIHTFLSLPLAKHMKDKRRTKDDCGSFFISQPDLKNEILLQSAISWYL